MGLSVTMELNSKDGTFRAGRSPPGGLAHKELYETKNPAKGYLASNPAKRPA